MVKRKWMFIFLLLKLCFSWDQSNDKSINRGFKHHFSIRAANDLMKDDKYPLNAWFRSKDHFASPARILLRIPLAWEDKWLLSGIYTQNQIAARISDTPSR